MRFLRRFFQVLLLAACVLEISARLLIPANAPFLQYPRRSTNPFVRSEWTPNYRGRININGIGGQKGSYELSINPFGFRGRSMQASQKPANTIRIFFQGGSLVESLAMPEDKTLSALVEQRLSASVPEQRFECLNAGLSGFMAADMLAQFQYQIMDYNPDILIITATAVNDLRYGTVPEYDPVHHTGLQKSEDAYSLFQQLTRHSRFFFTFLRLASRLYQEWFPYTQALENYQRQYRRIPKTKMAASRALPDFENCLSRLIRLAKNRHVRVLLTSEPSIYQTPLPPEIENRLWMGLMRRNINLSPTFLEQETRRFNKAAEMLAKENDAEWIDLAAQIPKTLENFYDDMHLTPVGSTRVAEVIFHNLLKIKQPMPLKTEGL